MGSSMGWIHDRWHQVAGVYDVAHNYLYVDGIQAGSGVASGAIAGETNHLYLGGDPDFTTVAVNERYFADRTDGLETARGEELLVATT